MEEIMVDLGEFIRSLGGTKPELHVRADPEQRAKRYTVVSVDDHLVEPPDTFTGRLPARFDDTAPRVIRRDDADWWVFEDKQVPLMGTDAIQSWEPGEGYAGPLTFEELRPATWNIHDRVRDMDLSGVAAQLCFPSSPFGFAGQVF